MAGISDSVIFVRGRNLAAVRKLTRMGATLFRRCLPFFTAVSVLIAQIGVPQPVLAAGNPPPVQTFYVPVPEDQAETAFVAINGTNGSGTQNTYVSIAAAGFGTRIYYDQWENGYDNDIANPVNLYSGSNTGGTQIWGDGIAANGCVPNKSGVAVTCTDANDVINSGDVIILSSAVNPATTATVMDFDARDKIGASSPIAVSRLGWPTTAGTLFAGATEVLDTRSWGTSYRVPVGTNTGSNSVFEYAAVAVMASTFGTVVTIDADGSGPGAPTTCTLNEGASCLVANMQQGATITSTAPVQVDLLTGHLNANYRSDWTTLYPTSAWSNSYYSPVGTNTSGGSATPTYIYLYNPGPASLTVRCDFASPNAPVTNTLAANASVSVINPNSSGARCFSTSPLTGTFFALGVVDADASNSSYDWSFTLVPETSLTPQATVGLGFGHDPTVTSTENAGPIWVTPACAAGTFVYVDWNNDGTPDDVDLNNDGTISGAAELDTSNGITLTQLSSLRLYDADGNQSGAIVFSLTGRNSTGVEGCALAVVWGEDPQYASAGTPGLDVGTTIPPLPLYSAGKGALFVSDLDGDGVAGPGDILEYTVVVQNTSFVPIIGVTVSDTVPLSTTYVAGSTKVISVTTSPQVTTTIADSGSGTPFPLDAGGIVVGTIKRGELRYVIFRAQVVNDLAVCDFPIINTAFVNRQGNYPITPTVATRLCEPKIDKAGPLTATAGTEITYTLYYTAFGSQVIPSVGISDALPSGVTFVPGSAVYVGGPSPITLTQNGQILQWALGQVTVPPPVSGVIRFRGLVDPSLAPGTLLVNNVVITDSFGDTDPGVFTTTVNAIADLGVSKDDGVGTYTSGGQLTYTVIVTNAGPSVAPNAIVSDVLPGQIQTWTWTCVGTPINASGCTPSAANSTSSFSDLVTISPSGRITYQVVANLWPTATGTLTNVATIAPPANIIDPNLTNNTARDVDTTSHDLRIVKGANAAALAGVAPGQTVTYSIAYTNTGPEASLGARLSDVVPVSTTYVSCAGGVSCGSTGAAAGSVVSWTLGNLAPGASSVVTLIVQITSAPILSGSVIVNNAAITDTSGLTKTTTVTVTANTSHTLFIDKVETPAGLVGPGQAVTYTLNYSVAGNEPALGVIVLDRVPANTTLLSCSGTGATCPATGAGSNVTWTIGTLIPPASGAVTMVVAVNAGVISGTLIVNTGVISDSKVPTKTDTTTNTVGVPSVVVAKSVNVPRNPLGAGDVVTYRLVLTNTSNVPAYDLTLTDTLPANVSYIADVAGNSKSSPAGAIGAPAQAGQQQIWAIGQLNSGGVATVLFTARIGAGVPASSFLTNTVTGSFTSQPGGPVSATNTATATVSSGDPVLSITKSATPSPVQAGGLLTYTIRVSNTGIVSATGVWISDVVPANTTFFSAVGATTQPLVGAGAGSLIQWNVGTLDANGLNPRTVTFTVQVNSPLISGTLIANTAMVTSTNSVTKTDTVTTPVNSGHTLFIDKVETPAGLVEPGQRITYTLNYSVTGNEPAVGIVLFDNVPANTTLVACSGTGAACPSTSAGSPVTWTIGTLTPVASGAVTMVVTVNAGVISGTLIVNTGAISDSTTPTKTDTVTNPVGVPNVVVAKSVSVPRNPLGANDVVTYQLVLTNTSTVPAYDLTLTDTLPANVSYVADVLGNSKTNPAGAIGSPTQAGQQQIWTIGQLNSGGVATVTFTARIAAGVPASALLTNTVAGGFTSQPGGPVSATNTATATVRSGDPALSITKSATASPVQAGTLLTYTIRVSNTGIVSATGVWISDVVPANTTFFSAVGATAQPLVGAGAGSLIQWNLGTLDANGLNARTVTFTVLVNTPLVTGTQIANTAIVTSTNSVTKTDTVTTPVNSSHNLFITKTVDAGGAVAPGRELLYTLTWLVTGNEPAPNVTLSDFIPANTTFVVGSCVPSCSGLNPLAWALGTQNPGTSGSVSFSVTVNTPLNNGTPIVNSGSISDSTGLTKTSTVTSPVFSSHTLFIDKVELPTGPVEPGQRVTYTLNYSVAGNEVAAGVVIRDVVPANTTLLSCSGTGALCPATGPGSPVTWTIGSLTPPSSGAVAMVVTVNAGVISGTLIVNTGVISDSKTPTKTDTVTNTVGVPSVFVAKSVTTPRNPLGAGDVVTYRLVLTNTSNVIAYDLTLTDTLPANVGYGGDLVGNSKDSPFGLIGSPSTSGQRQVWVIGQLNSGGVASIVFTATIGAAVPANTTLLNTAAGGFTSQPGGPVSATNTATATVESGDPILTIVKSATPAPVQAGGLLTYTIQVNNTGIVSATNVWITEVVPANTSFFSAVGAGRTGSGCLRRYVKRRCSEHRPRPDRAV